MPMIVDFDTREGFCFARDLGMAFIENVIREPVQGLLLPPPGDRNHDV